MENMSFARRTIFYGPASSGLDFKLDWAYDQGAITPMFMTYQNSCCIGGTAEINHFYIDTSAMPMYDVREFGQHRSEYHRQHDERP